MIFDKFYDRLKYGYSTRKCGVSSGIYESMNLSNSMGDDPEKVRKNFEIWLGSYGLDIRDIVSLQQIHSDNIIVAGEAERGRGPISGRIPDADAMITNTKGLILCTGHADCAPIYIYDPVQNAIGLAHAGWRGTTLGISSKTALAMKREFGSEPKDMYAMIGPCIHIAGFECDEDVAAAVAAMDIHGETFCYYDEEACKYHVSIPDVNREVLIRAGLKPENIEISPECTFEMADKYFSHRRQGSERGGQAAFLTLV